MSERVRFIDAYVKHEVSFSKLCENFGISRKTGYKWVERFHAEGVVGLRARKRSPNRHPNATAPDAEERVLAVRRANPTWGARKIVAFLRGKKPDLALPATSTVGAILKRRGMVAPRRRRVRIAQVNPNGLTKPSGPNDVWAADHKGEYPLGGKPRKLCYPLTMSDLHSRYLLKCQSLGSRKHSHAYPVFLAAFREYGLPRVIRTDNGGPFATRAPGGLSHLSVWWIRLGIKPERIQPGKPTQNASHERMHRTLKAEATYPRSTSLSAQQRRFDVWRNHFNEVRPHESLDMATPSDCYATSEKAYPRRIRKPSYDEGYQVVQLSDKGRGCIRGRRLHGGAPLASQLVGCLEVTDGVLEVRFYHYLVGHINLRHEGGLRPR
jgi:transposase InsO family protein